MSTRQSAKHFHRHDRDIGAKMTVRGIEHIGITVPNLDQATEFFVKAFDAIYMYDIIDSPVGGKEIESGLGVPEGTTIQSIRVLRLGNGPNLELFDYSNADQQGAARPCDLGYQHVALDVDDITAASDKLQRAGATLLGDGPTDLPGNEAGAKNQFLYARTPWGSTIELVTYPSPQAYESLTTARKWRPQPPMK
jgi:catechol 2,3-dioxygenase-like lactoylglutathione lyase family enzyme